MADRPGTAMLHYTAPPIVGGVEAVIRAHAAAFLQAGYPVTVIAGRGQQAALPAGARFVSVDDVDSRRPRILEMAAELAAGRVPPGFDTLARHLASRLGPILDQFDNLIVHNVLSKDFNLPLTAALHHLLDAGLRPQLIAWGHDFSWTSPSSRLRMHDGHPWDLLRTFRPDVTYVAVSQERQQVLAELLGCSPRQIRVVYNGVDPQALLGLSPTGGMLVERLGLLAADLVLLMPVRVTRAKNVEYGLHVVAALQARGIRPRLVVTGPPDPHDAGSLVYFRSLQDLRRALGVEEAAHFVFEVDGDAQQPLTVGPEVIGDLYRVADVLFMPSHREGFAMPVLEAGLAGIPVFCTAVPAAVEIGGQDVVLLDVEEEPVRVAERLLAWAAASPVHRLRRRVRQGYTWQTLFHQQIEPLLRSTG